MIIEFVAGFVIVGILLYIFWKLSQPKLFFEKVLAKGKSKVIIKTGKPLKRVMLSDKANGEKLSFVRNDIKKGEALEFIYPASTDTAQLIIDDENGTNTFRLTPKM